MHISTKSKRNILLFLLAFFMLNLIRVLIYYRDIFCMYSFAELGAALLVILWMSTIRVRILQKEIRQQLMIIGSLLLLYFCLQMAKYVWLKGSPVIISRVIWSAYYIPMTAIPFHMFLASQGMGLDDAARKMAKYQWIVILEILLCILYLTNVRHQLLVRYAPLPDIDEGAQKGILYWIYLAWTITFFGAAFVTILRRCRLRNRLRYIWLPLLPLINGIVYFVLGALHKDLYVNGVRWVNLGQMFAFMIVGYLEGFIQIGMISSNSGYDQLFDQMSGQARILDKNDHVIYASQGIWPGEEISPVSTKYFETDEAESGNAAENRYAEENGYAAQNGNIAEDGNAAENGYAVENRYAAEAGYAAENRYAAEDGNAAESGDDENIPDIRILETPISGGKFLYVENLANLNRLNREIREATERIEHRNEYLQSEAELQAERSAIKERSQLYDQIREIVRPQTSRIQSLLDKGDDEALAQAAILTAYIKRRSNLEMLAFDSARSTVQELEMAIRESAEYMQLCDIETAVILRSGIEDNTELVIRTQIAYYELFEWWIERCLPDLKYIQILLDCRNGNFRMRIRQNGLPDTRLEELQSEADSQSRFHQPVLHINLDSEEEELLLTVWEEVRNA